MMFAMNEENGHYYKMMQIQQYTYSVYQREPENQVQWKGRTQVKDQMELNVDKPSNV